MKRHEKGPEVEQGERLQPYLPCSLDPSFSTKIPEERRQKGVQEILEGVRSEYQAGETLGRSYWQGRLPGVASSYIGKGTGSGMS